MDMSRAVQGPAATPNLRHLVLFEDVVRRGSVSAAARAAHLSQPAVTQAVAQVEAALGARLMQRSYAGLSLTGAGRAAAQRIERALQMLREALSAVRPRAPGAHESEVLRGITSTQLQALMAVAEAGAFARAARRVGRARAAVHRAARQLEKSLGTELFEVTSYGVRPTREARSIGGPRAGTGLEISALKGDLGHTVIQRCRRARRARAPAISSRDRAPEHRVEILTGPTRRCRALRTGGADVLVNST
jgi:DNA-binding transcriptional LysR family regulator